MEIGYWEQSYKIIINWFLVNEANIIRYALTSE
jgi:hypothetical protein